MSGDLSLDSNFEDRGIFNGLSIFGGFSPKISHAVHVMCFPSILTERANGVAIFGVIGSLGLFAKRVVIWGAKL
jgi:hypothetical protein